MSGEESFLARWSRRKRTAATPDRQKPEDAGDRAPVERSPAASPPEERRPALDPTTLPPIESIGPGCDIRAFLAPDVPADLMRAALRRAWSADPAIRDFVGLSENAWDFNAPGGVPGSGAVTAEDVRRLLERVMAPPDSPATEQPVEASAGEAAAPADDDVQGTPGSRSDQGERERQELVPDAGAAALVGSRNAALQHDLPQREGRPSAQRRGHGGALPK